MLPHPSSSSLIEEYRRYRKAATDLNTKIVKTLVDSGVISEAAHALDLGRGRQLVLDRKDDLSVLMDFALYELRRQGKSLVERYQQDYGGSGAIEQELLAAMVEAQTGLFRVEKALPQQCQVLLRNLGEDETSINLTDVGFSQTMIDGMIIFFRPVALARFTMTSGIAFVFPPEMEQALKNRWHREWKGVRSARRYADLFKLSKRKGLNTMFA
jgi:hypothetical protein